MGHPYGAPQKSQCLIYLLNLHMYSFIYLFLGAESFLRNKSVQSYSRNSPHIIQTKASSPHSQQPATCRYPEPEESSPCPTSHFLKIYLNVILPPPSGSSKSLLSFRFPQQNLAYTPPLSHKYYMPHHLIFHDFITRAISGEVYRSLSSSLCSFPHFNVTSSLLGLNILLNTQFSNTLSLRSKLNVSDHISHPHKTTGKFIALYMLIFIFLDSKLEDKRFCTE